MNHPLGAYGSQGNILYAAAEGDNKWENAWAQILQDGAEVLRSAGGVYGIITYGHSGTVTDADKEGLSGLLPALTAVITDEANNSLTAIPDEKLGDRVIMTLFVVKQDLSE